MITSFNQENYELNGQMNAVSVNTVNAALPNAELWVYIPKIMANIEKGTPAKRILKTSGKSVFANGNKKPVLSRNVLYEKNFMGTQLNAISNIDDLNNSTKNLINEVNHGIAQLASINDLSSVTISKKISYIIKSNTELRVEFLNGKINRLAFTTMDKTQSDKNFE